MNDIEALSEQLGSLRITEEALSKDKQTDTEMSTVPALTVNKLVGMPKNMVPDPG